MAAASAPPAGRAQRSPKRAIPFEGPRAAVAFSEIAWSPRRELALVDWLRHGRWLGTLGRSSGWWIGDWLRYGNAKYGERYPAAAKITGYDVQSLMNMAYVASRFEISRRRENLSFSHHAEVSALPPQQQEHWLDRAEYESLSVHALRDQLRQETGPPRRRSRSRSATAPAEPAEPRREFEVVCPSCGERFSAPADASQRPTAP